MVDLEYLYATGYGALKGIIGSGMIFRDPSEGIRYIASASSRIFEEVEAALEQHSSKNKAASESYSSGQKDQE